MRLLLVLVALVLPSSARPQEWSPSPDTTSALLAAEGWYLNGVPSLSWPDGQQAVVTFWDLKSREARYMFRCVTSFNADLQETGEVCSQVTHAGAPSQKEVPPARDDEEWNDGEGQPISD